MGRFLLLKLPSRLNKSRLIVCYIFHLFVDDGNKLFLFRMRLNIHFLAILLEVRCTLECIVNFVFLVVVENFVVEFKISWLLGYHLLLI